MSFTQKFLSQLSMAAAPLALIFSLSIMPAQAANETTESSSLEQIFQLQVNSYYSVNGFYNFSANQGSQTDLAIINDSTNKIGDLIGSLKSQVADNKSPAFKDVLSAWKSYRKVLKQNIKEVKKTGYPDLRLAGEMATENIQLNSTLQTLYDTLVETSKPKPDQATQASRKAATTLALMMTKYSARTTSTVSQVYAGGDVETEVTIDSLAKEFENKLEDLMTFAKDNAKALKLLDSAKTKWEFIESSYINYNENRVNFIVNLYSKKIISDIDDALQSI